MEGFIIPVTGHNRLNMGKDNDDDILKLKPIIGMKSTVGKIT
jgi:hypothetical protein